MEKIERKIEVLRIKAEVQKMKSGEIRDFKIKEPSVLGNVRTQLALMRKSGIDTATHYESSILTIKRL
jgi:hypothetical protein